MIIAGAFLFVIIGLIATVWMTHTQKKPAGKPISEQQARANCAPLSTAIVQITHNPKR
jgi:hypothetical protein